MKKLLAALLLTVCTASAQPFRAGYMTTNPPAVQIAPRFDSAYLTNGLTNGGNFTLVTDGSQSFASLATSLGELWAYRLTLKSEAPGDYITLQAPFMGGGGYFITFPDTPGYADSVMLNNGSGTLSWISYWHGHTNPVFHGPVEVVIVGTATNDVFRITQGGTNLFRMPTNGQLLAHGGTASRPAYSFMNAPDTGMYWSSTLVNFSIDGSAKFSIDSGANAYLYGGGLYLGGSSLNRVGINVDGENIISFRNSVHDRSAVSNRIYMAHAGTPTSQPTNAIWGEWAADTNLNWFALRTLADGSNQTARPLALSAGGTNPAVMITTDGVVCFPQSTAATTNLVAEGSGGATGGFIATNAVNFLTNGGLRQVLQMTNDWLFLNATNLTAFAGASQADIELQIVPQHFYLATNRVVVFNSSWRRFSGAVTNSLGSNKVGIVRLRRAGAVNADVWASWEPEL